MSWAHYLLQANIYLLVFYGFYKLLLEKETYFTFNRIYLLCAAILPFCIPFLRFNWFSSPNISKPISVGMEQVNVLLSGTGQLRDDLWQLNTGAVIVSIYLLGLFVFMIKFILQLFLVASSLKNTRKGMATSFLNKKSVDPELPGLEVIHQHEDIHIRQLHSADILLFELIAMLNWFNPVMYGYKAAIRNVHEYLADEHAAAFSETKDAYAMLLLNKAFGMSESKLNHNFFKQSMLKKRIAMLYKEKSAKTAVLKYGLFLPLFGMALLLSSASLRTNEKLVALSEELPLNNPVSSVKEAIEPLNIVLKDAQQPGQVKKQEKIYDFTSLDQQPVFKGGVNELYRYLAKNIKYPKNAVQRNIQGKVFLSFIVEKDGSVNHIHVDRGLNTEIDHEAVRVLAAMPKWSPGKIKGKVVRVKYNIPVAFTLSNGQKESNSASARAKTTDGPAETWATTDKSIALGKNSYLKLSSGGENAPLYILNGKKVEDFDVQTINPNEIESVSILKNSSAAAMYAEEGKNGVILITTKAPGKPASKPAAKSTN
ncbi:M56 family metallopeptidase [Pedobacter nutrimenti]|jgi:TonB family protein|uniref:TonB family protein n=1 Tax=Pedobacter nutrimenti TaxID=1241337 RepID=A0A318UIQ1_9SPHI|nr:M56 family metallopeptidase [Pedobacter nutrimenti]PYF76003.1 TonB family protein [Pedobacter nutrimenti]